LANTGATECQHWQPGCSSVTGTVVRSHSDTSELSVCNCQLEEHPVGDIEPVKFVVQYLTQAVVKLLSADDDVHSSIQHML